MFSSYIKGSFFVVRVYEDPGYRSVTGRLRGLKGPDVEVRFSGVSSAPRRPEFLVKGSGPFRCKHECISVRVIWWFRRHLGLSIESSLCLLFLIHELLDCVFLYPRRPLLSHTESQIPVTKNLCPWVLDPGSTGLVVFSFTNGTFPRFEVSRYLLPFILTTSRRPHRTLDSPLGRIKASSWGWRRETSVRRPHTTKDVEWHLQFRSRRNTPPSLWNIFYVENTPFCTECYSIRDEGQNK